MAQDALAKIPVPCGRFDDLQIEPFAAGYIDADRDHGDGHAIIWESCQREIPVIRRNRITDFSFIWPRTKERGWFTDRFAFLDGTPPASSGNYALQCPVVKLYDCLANVIEVSFSLLDWVKYYDPHSF